MSGNGRELGEYGLESYTEVKSVSTLDSWSPYSKQLITCQFKVESLTGFVKVAQTWLIYILLVFLFSPFAVSSI